MCWWEDEATEPWEYSGPNYQTLLEAQQAYLLDGRPYRLRPGKVRAPKRREARDPDWRPLELTDDLVDRVRRTNEKQQRYWEAEDRRAAQEVADDPEGPFKEYTATMHSLAAEAPGLSHHEVRSRVSDLGRESGFVLPGAYLELQSRLIKDANFYRGHPVRAIWWLLRYARPGSLRRRWEEVRTGTFHMVG